MAVAYLGIHAGNATVKRSHLIKGFHSHLLVTPFECLVGLGEAVSLKFFLAGTAFSLKPVGVMPVCADIQGLQFGERENGHVNGHLKTNNHCLEVESWPLMAGAIRWKTFGGAEIKRPYAPPPLDVIKGRLATVFLIFRRLASFFLFSAIFLRIVLPRSLVIGGPGGSPEQYIATFPEA